MQTARRLSTIGGIRRLQYGQANRNMIYNTRRCMTDHNSGRVNDGGWETAGLHTLLCLWGGVFFVIAMSDGSWGIISKCLPFSFGKPRQGAYFPPHCRYITPYDDIVREHKRKLKAQQEAHQD
eukprot:273622_1